MIKNKKYLKSIGYSKGEAAECQLTVEKFAGAIDKIAHYCSLTTKMMKTVYHRSCYCSHQQHPMGIKILPPLRLTDIVVDEFGARVVQKVFELYATASYSMDLLCQKLKVDHGIAWPRGYLGKLLSNTFYYGEMLLLRTRLRRTGRTFRWSGLRDELSLINEYTHVQL